MIDQATDLTDSQSLNGVRLKDCDRLVVVSNRLPITVKRDGNGELQVKPSSGGLVTALQPVLRSNGGLWIGWPDAAAATDMNEAPDGEFSRPGFSLEPVFLSDQELAEYYLGFSNQVLWPLFHDLPGLCRPLTDHWHTYRDVNRKFAGAVASISDADDYIWVHDYHLLLVAQWLRDMGVKRRTGFFLHTPFPSSEVFRRLPWRTEIIEALLEYDLIGFQAQRDMDNFVQCLEESGAGWHYKDRDGMVVVNGAKDQTVVGVFPISIDFSEFETLAVSDEVQKRADQLRHDLEDRRIILGVDRLDYSKGIPLRLQAYRALLERFRNLHGRVVMIQIVVPSRDEIPEYRAVKSEIEDLVDDINARFGNGSWLPVHYMYRSLGRRELVAYYRAADIALITPVKDGMNLIAKEYCAANIDNDGILILSSYAGAADQMRGQALLIDPHDIGALAGVICQACHMPLDERRARMRMLRHSVREQDIHWWSDLFLRSAQRYQEKPLPHTFTPVG